MDPTASLRSKINEPQSPINPQLTSFDARAWAIEISKTKPSRHLGVSFRNLSVTGYHAPTDFQKDVGNVWIALPGIIVRRFLQPLANNILGRKRVDILRGFDGVIRPGELCVVLGPPGSGCSTFLKAVSGRLEGLEVTGAGGMGGNVKDEESIESEEIFNYHGLTTKEMRTWNRGEVIYAAETDNHFPMLTVRETLGFAVKARVERNVPQGVGRDEYCDHLCDVAMALYGISHIKNTKVGDDVTRGVSGGERKRVTIAEATLSNAPLQCWDNSTRGLDSANAIEFCKTLRLQADVFQHTYAVSLYQAPQAAYNVFDKTLVIYEGKQIYFGPASLAEKYFIGLGFEKPKRQTTPDFLTSMTFPAERIVRLGCHPPKTSDEFAAAWKSSPEYAPLLQDIDEYNRAHPFNGPSATAFRNLKREHQAAGQRLRSPYTLTYGQQVRLCMQRGRQRFRADPWPTLAVAIANSVLALIMSSLFYNLPSATSSFYGRSVVLFMSILFNAFASLLEILAIYAQRPIVEKQMQYAFCHPSAESYASVLVDLPVKISSAVAFNMVFYFMTNLRREPGAFFFYLLVAFLIVLAMSGAFRFLGSLTRTIHTAMIPATLVMLGLIVFTGFVIPVSYMKPWYSWLRYINPIFYGFEALLVNEFYGRNFACSQLVPDYPRLQRDNQACSAIGAVAGQDHVSGGRYLSVAYGFQHGHKWRNVGILFIFVIFNYGMYFLASEYITGARSQGEILMFRRGRGGHGYNPSDIENTTAGMTSDLGKVNIATKSGSKERQFLAGNENALGSSSVFHWRDVSFDMKINNKPRRILDHVDGWVKPGTLTALMGVSGAGKTTLLDCLADRRGGMGILTGGMFVDGRRRDESFQRSCGYVMQADVHATSVTVREALTFSALLRQAESTPKSEKLAYVEHIISLLSMQDYADAVIGVPGSGLNIEQRKHLTIAVELVAKPPLLLFVDEPTSGLDSQTSWAILDLLERLSRAGQSILCTIHQPSAMLFQRFDRVLVLEDGGRTVYFGDIGRNSETLISYFERNGAPHCPTGANPAEWMLEAIGAAPVSHSDIDWHAIWRSSPEYTAVQTELARLEAQEGTKDVKEDVLEPPSIHSQFATSLWTQFKLVTERAFQQTWRTPTYIYSKLLLTTLASLFIGLIFLSSPLSIQSLQNQEIAIFELLSITGQLIESQLPHFISARDLYEVRERPSKTYSWVVFMGSQIVSELPWNIVLSLPMYFLVYFPVGFHKNAAHTGQSGERGTLMFLLFLQLQMWISTFAHLCGSFSGNAEQGGQTANFLFIFAFFFCGVLAPPYQIPGVWKWLYKVSPLNYWVSAVLSTGVGNVEVRCSKEEMVKFAAPEGSTCTDYMSEYIERMGGYVTDGMDSECAYCRVADTNVWLEGVGVEYGERWRNFGIVWVYVAANILGAVALYWVARMPKSGRRTRKSQRRW